MTVIATTTSHVPHEDKLLSIAFSKTGGTLTEAGIQKTITAVDASDFEGETIIRWQILIPDVTNADYTFLRLGTDASNYSEWQAPCDEMTSGRWAQVVEEQHQLVSQTGAGADFSAITYIAIGVVFDAAANTLNSIVAGYCSLHTTPYVTANLGFDITTNISASTRVQKFGPANSGNVPVGAGNVTNGTQRVTIATNDVNMAALSAAVKTVGAAKGATAYQIAGTDGTNAVIIKTDATGVVQTSGSADFTATHAGAANATVAMIAGKDALGNAYTVKVDTDGVVQTSGSADFTATVGAAHNATVSQTGISDGTNARHWEGSSSTGAGYIEAPPKTETTVLAAVTADNGAPAGAVGTALQSNTRDAVIEVWCGADVTNADINVYVRARGSAIWYIPSGGALVDLQDQTGDRWSVILHNVGTFADSIYVEVDNYASGAGANTVSATMIEEAGV